MLVKDENENFQKASKLLSNQSKPALGNNISKDAQKSEMKK